MPNLDNSRDLPPRENSQEIRGLSPEMIQMIDETVSIVMGRILAPLQADIREIEKRLGDLESGNPWSSAASRLTEFYPGHDHLEPTGDYLIDDPSKWSPASPYMR